MNTNKNSRVEKNNLSQRLAENLDYSDFQMMHIVAFSGFALFLMIMCNGYFLKWVEEYSIFLPTSFYFSECMRFAGGLLVYAGTFLTQLFYYPVLGSITFVTILFLIQFLSVYAFRIPRKYFPLTFIPGLMLLLSVTQLGYVWLSLKSPGYFFSNALGIVAFLLCFIGYKSINTVLFRIIGLFIIVVAGYSLFGFYALFTGFICLLYDLLRYRRSKAMGHLIVGIVGVLLIIVVPIIGYYFVYSYMQSIHIYTAVLPRFAFSVKELSLWLPFIVIFVLYAVSLFLPSKEDINPENKKLAIFPSVIFVLVMVFTYSQSYQDDNFKAEIKMNEALENNNWQKVISIAQNLKGNPTRSIVLDYHLALLMEGKTDAIGLNLDNTVKANSKRPVMPLITLNMSGRQLLYKSGEVNDCYRWSMEDMVEYGMRVSYLKYMVRCAILNEEYPLAQKYNAILAETLFHKDWARKYQTLIDNPRLIRNDPEMKVIQSLSKVDGLNLYK